MNCVHCGKRIEEPTKAWREMVSWVSPDAGKSSTLAKGTGRLMHKSCVDLRKAGIDAQQGTLA